MELWVEEYLSLPALLDTIGNTILIVLHDDRCSLEFFLLKGYGRRGFLGGLAVKQKNDWDSQPKPLTLTGTCT